MKSTRALLALLALTACSGDRASMLSHPALSTKADQPLVAEEAKESAPPDRSIDVSKIDPKKVDGLKFTAKPAPVAPPKPALKASIEPLSEKDVNALLARLPPIQTEADDV